VVITDPTPHSVIVGAAVLSVGITIEDLSVAFRGTVTPEMPLAIVPTSKTRVCLPHSEGMILNRDGGVIPVLRS
jgi:hypothetical protein